MAEKEYIERDAIYKQLVAVKNVEKEDFDFMEILDAVEDIPAADVESVRHGYWEMRHRRRGGLMRYTGTDDMGELHTITVDQRVEYDDRYCSECGKQSADNFLNYCSNCGAKMDGGKADEH